jgi:hypothetical protein
MDGSAKNYVLSVYANYADESYALANQLANYVENTAVMNPVTEGSYDCSVGVKKPVFDVESLAYKTDIVVLVAGNLRVINEGAGIATPPQPPPDCSLSIWHEDAMAYDDNGFWYAQCAAFYDYPYIP